MKELTLKGKNALVCGSTQGIGWSTAVELAKMGANVTLMARNESKLKQCLRELPIPANQFHGYLLADFERPEEVKNEAQLLLDHGQDIHILINNTGGPSGGNLIEESSEKLLAVFNQHLIVNHQLAQLFFEGMKKANFGRIVNIISVSVKQPIVGLGVSNTIRWAVASWAKTLSKEISKYGITVNNVLPGYTLTSRLDQVLDHKSQQTEQARENIEKEFLTNIPTGRFATPEEVAAAAAFLCSPMAGSINGINLPVDGGLSMSL